MAHRRGDALSARRNKNQLSRGKLDRLDDVESLRDARYRTGDIASREGAGAAKAEIRVGTVEMGKAVVDALNAGNA